MDIYHNPIIPVTKAPRITELHSIPHSALHPTPRIPLFVCWMVRHVFTPTDVDVVVLCCFVRCVGVSVVVLVVCGVVVYVDGA